MQGGAGDDPYVVDDLTDVPLELAETAGGGGNDT